MFKLLSLVIPLSLISSIAITPTASKTLQILNHESLTTEKSYNTFINSIKDESDSPNVKIYLNWGAALPDQQIYLSMLAALNSPAPSAQQWTDSVIISRRIFQNETNVKYHALLDQYGEITNQNKSTDAKLLYVNNLNKIPGVNESSTLTDEQKNESFNFNGIGFTVNSLDYLNRFYSATFPDAKYDLWVTEHILNQLWSAHPIQLLDFFSKVDKIYLMSDGNLQTNSFVFDYVRRFKETNLTIDQARSNWNAIVANDADSVNVFNNSSIFDFLRLDDVFKTFHITDYTDTDIYGIPAADMYKTYPLNLDHIVVSNQLFTPDQTVLKEKFIREYESLFGVDQINSVADMIVSGKENYDPSKKNIVWLGDALISNVNNVNQASREELQDTFEALTKKYPPKEFNYFFKMHPRFSQQVSDELIAFYTAKTPEVKPLTISTAIPWEVLLAKDSSLLAADPNRQDFFFSTNTNNDVIPKTTLVGIQYTTTAIPATLFYLTNNYGMSLSNAFKSVSFENWPIPMTFDILTFGANTNLQQQLESNRTRIDNIYAVFRDLGKFEDYSSQPSSEQFIQSQSVPVDFDPNLTPSNQNPGSNNPTSDGSIPTNSTQLEYLWLLLLIPAIGGLAGGSYFFWRKKHPHK
ncbi:hypothetical protein [[Mycoplasma] testudinis]|uniref:hypothetical protein n=1 Tax=[Mycoplasma] testudinis TaxID=33924 RepID=UPI000487C050|nr:hypothetical protein [[Mycoplasma] testudinis]